MLWNSIFLISKLLVSLLVRVYGYTTTQVHLSISLKIKLDYFLLRQFNLIVRGDGGGGKVAKPEPEVVKQHPDLYP